MKYSYQIKTCPNEWSDISRPTLAQGLVEKNDKKEVLRFIEEKYPEYFEGKKAVQKLSKNTENIVYVTIYELDDYWENYWTQEVECMVCGKKIPLTEVRNHLGNINIKKFACSLECEEKRKECADNEVDEYWNIRCPYFFIYRIYNKINGKSYIGYTEREPIFRWWEHFKHSKLPIGLALKKYGIESFTFEVLEKHLKENKTVEEMHRIETNYMCFYDSVKNGYNCIVSSLSDLSH